MDEGPEAEECGADLEEEGSGVAVLESKIRDQHFLYDRATLAMQVLSWKFAYATRLVD